ncbi:site-specific DNA-methyltransferase [Tsuneonella sp. CC-YZS046]|uniref:site-specific DNA-methyltransferase n=1 Tax=Tsuneonella sp. CC-YZS046 TaxID=3042152 RepID=UPI002D77BDA1|nr:site-specific DNA-methyltransferase [Tsuneonella sp. CC-YZS046]WRO67737.1 site-specific DNA-methyltransferase [Tsuneonella sp. CC-YZS046]
MTIKKLDMQTPQLSRDIATKILEAMPELATEAVDESGSIQQLIDFDLLKTVLEGHVIEGARERYHLNWPGKASALIESNAPIRKTLRPDMSESVNFNSTKNLFIEGDNLDALKLLRETYLGRVDMIYIDPPYNTGSDLIYHDDYSENSSAYLERSGQVDEDGGRLVANSQSNGRFHSDWLSMMYPRLRIARQLLADTGIIFISIDDNERANLQKLCEEVFGGQNFLGCFVWKRRSGAMDAVTNLSEDHEYVLVYTKSKGILKGVQRTFEKYANPDNDPRGPWISDNLSAGKPGGDTHYPITDPASGREYLPPKGRYWPYSRTTMARKISEGRVLFPKDGKGVPMLKRFASEAVKPTIPVSSWIERPNGGGGQSTIVSPMNSSATTALKSLFEGKLFSFPKPVELISALIDQGAGKNALILDFFAGSGTTAQAVFECNAADGGNRRYILIQLPEAVGEESDAFKEGYRAISDLTKERIRRAGKKVLEGERHGDWNGDVGFRVFKIASSNMKDVYYRPDELKQSSLLDMIDNVKEGRTPEDLLFQVLVDWGVDLSLPIHREAVHGKTVFFVDDNALIACFDDGVTEDLVEEIAKSEPLRVVFRDSGFISDAVKINAAQILRQISATTDLKVI